MTETVFKAPKVKKSPPSDEVEEVPATANKRPRTSEDFYLFCKFILEYENYETIKEEEKREKTASPLETTESTIKNENTESSSSRETIQDEENNSLLKSDEEENYDLVTCYCEKPFAGRAMIECCECLTWIHLSCAKIKKTQIPEVFLCVKCKSSGKCSKVPPPAASLRHKKRLRMTV